MKTKMQAIVWTKYGAPAGLQLRTVEIPVPKAEEILVKIHATHVLAGDCEMRRLELPLGLGLPIRLYVGYRKPHRIPILGQEFAGEVVATGDQVSTFQTGERVFGTTGLRCGAYAEYICLPAPASSTLVTIPENVSYASAAVTPTSGMEALHFLRTADLEPGQRLMIIGAGGSIGTFAVQLARHFGLEVTAVDSTEKLEMLRAIGADRVVDYTIEDITRGNAAYDAIIDVVGGRAVARRLRRLRPGGIYFLANASIRHVFLGRWSLATRKRRLSITSSRQTREELLFLRNLLETGTLKPVIGNTWSLEEMAAAHRFAETGRKIGNIAIEVGEQV